jgi:hypothetical protein
MTDREREGFKGPAHQVTLERPFAATHRFIWLFDEQGKLLKTGFQNADGTEFATEYRYNQHGELIEPSPPTKIPTEHGMWDEVEDLSGVGDKTWPNSKARPFTGTAPGDYSYLLYTSSSSKNIPPPLKKLSMGFAGQGASRVVTRFDPQGIPMQITFLAEKGEITAQVVFRSDQRGNIVEVDTYGGTTPLLKLRWFERALMTSSNKRELAPLLQPHCLLTRTTFKYDAKDNIIESEAFVLDKLNTRTIYTYNEHGDTITIEQNDAPPTRFEYKYDEFGNWTYQLVHGAYDDNVYESTRLISYYK